MIPKALNVVINLLPVAAAVASCMFWIDTRYMHKEMSDARFIDMQISLYQREIRSHERRVEGLNYKPSSTENREYNLMIDSLKELEKQRNRLIGLDE